MGNESPEITARNLIISFIDDNLVIFSTQMTEREKKIYYAVLEQRSRLEAEIAALEGNTTK